MCVWTGTHHIIRRSTCGVYYFAVGMCKNVCYAVNHIRKIISTQNFL